MHAGHVISGSGHALLIGWLLFGSFSIPPEPAVEVTNVALVSNEEYAAMLAAQEPPGAATEVEAPEAPEADQAGTPEVSDMQDAQPEQAAPEVTETTEQDAAPAAPVAVPEPQEVTDTAPEIAPPSEDIAALPPEPRPEPDAAPQDVPRVAPQPVARPEPDVKVDEQVQQPAEQSEDAEVEQEEQEATAPEEATTEIVTEAEEEKSLAPSVSKRPQARPEVRQAAVEPEPEPEPEPKPEPEARPDPKPEAPKQDEPDAVAAALEKALGGGESESETPAPSGPPLTSGEKDALRVAVSSCWNTGSLSSDALRVTVVVSVSMQEDGRPNGNSIRMVSSSGGSDAAARQAFEAARRAIIRCGASGYDLPREKYGQWRDIEMTFNPENMRIK